MRKIIQIITDAECDNWWALCNDGTIWRWDHQGWVRSGIKSIPQEE